MPEATTDAELRASPTTLAEPASPLPAAATRARNLWAVARERVPFVLALVLVAFLLRAIAAVTVEQVSIAVGYGGFLGPLGGDDLTYDLVAWQQAQAWRGAGPPVHPADRYLLNVYTHTQAGLYLIVGHQPLAMKVLNCLFGALTAGLVYLMGRRLFGERAARVGGVAAAFFPSVFFWSVVNLKEAMFLFWVAVLLWALTWLVTTGGRWLIVPVMVALVVVGGLRSYVQTFLLALIPATILLQSRTRMPHKWQALVLALLSCLAVNQYTGAWALLQITPVDLNNQRFEAARGADSAFVPTPLPREPVPTGTSPVTPGVGGAGVGAAGRAAGTIVSMPGITPVPTPVPTADTTAAPAPPPQPPLPSEVSARARSDLIRWAPLGLVHALGAPFPWQADRMIERVTIPEMLLWYVALVLALTGGLTHWRRWQSYVHILGYIGAMLLIFALIQGNLGTLVRQRGMIIPFTLIFSGAGAAWLWDRWRARRTQPGSLP